MQAFIKPVLVIIIGIGLVLVSSSVYRRTFGAWKTDRSAPLNRSSEPAPPVSKQTDLPPTASAPNKESTQNRDDLHETALVAQLNDIDFLTNKIQLAEQLAVFGGDLSAGALIEIVDKDYANAVFSVDEEAAINRILLCLGYISARSRTALEFLRSGTKMEKWENSRSWSCPNQPDLVINRNLAGNCLNGLGAGRQTALWEEIRRIQEAGFEPLEAERWGVHMLGAVFYFDLSATMEVKQLLELDGHDLINLYFEWTTKNKSHEIVRWYEDKKRAITK